MKILLLLGFKKTCRLIHQGQSETVVIMKTLLVKILYRVESSAVQFAFINIQCPHAFIWRSGWGGGGGEEVGRGGGGEEMGRGKRRGRGGEGERWGGGEEVGRGGGRWGGGEVGRGGGEGEVGRGRGGGDLEEGRGKGGHRGDEVNRQY